jgi:hypothetical protein
VVNRDRIRFEGYRHGGANVTYTGTGTATPTIGIPGMWTMAARFR